MIEFDLERALKGDAVADASLRASRNHNPSGIKSDTDLFMVPEKLSGFVNFYGDGAFGGFGTVCDSEEECKVRREGEGKILACIDLSQFDVGHGL